MKKYQALIYPLGIIILIKFIFIFSFFGSMEHLAQDALFRLRGGVPYSGKVAVVGIDDETFNSLNMSWPFPRGVHGKLIDNLTRAGVRLIVFDVEFTESGDPTQDLLLAEAAARANNVIFAGKLVQGSGSGIHHQRYTPIRPIMQRDLSWAYVNTSPDADGVMRKYTCYMTSDNEYLYTLGVAALANYRYYQPEWDKHIKVEHGKLKVIDIEVPLATANEALVNFRGPANSLPYYSYSSILDDAQTIMEGQVIDGEANETDDFEAILASGELKDKIVFIGAATAELHDDFPTPYSSKNWTPGVEIHASFTDMALQRDFLYDINPLLYLALELMFLVLLWFVFRKLKPQYGAIILVVLIVAQLLLAYWMFTKANMLIPIVQTLVLFILVYVASIVSHYLATMKEKRFIKNAFQQYMAPELVNQLLNNPKSLQYGGSLQEITVLFSDIRSFTTYSENHRPEETVQILKEYLTAMVNIIVDNKGILDKFVGDEVMALYGTPVELPNSALSACKTALQMREKLTELQLKWREEGREDFEIGIGINTGMAVVGNLGSEQIFDYTAIGDTINLGARLEAINKEYNTAKHIIISEFTLEKVQDLVDVEYLDEVKVKGKNNAVKIYALLGIK